MPKTMQELVETEIEEAFTAGELGRWREAVRQQAMLEALAKWGETDPDNFRYWLEKQAGVR